MKKLKTQMLCVLISGPLRTLSEVWPHNLRILNSLEIDFACFVHTWDVNIATYKDPMDGYAGWIWEWKKIRYQPQPNYNLLEVIEKDIMAGWEIDNYDEYLLNVPLQDCIKIRKDVMNSVSMFYGMQKVISLAEQSDFQFSHALRLRPDFMLPEKFLFSTDNKIVFHGGGVSINGKNISDQCFSGSFEQVSNLMKFYSNLMEEIITTKKSSNEILMKIAENGIYSQLCTNKYLDKFYTVPKENLGRIVRPKLIEDRSVPLHKFYYRGIIRKKEVYKKKLYKLLVFIKYK
jgi:hypothetical protein